MYYEPYRESKTYFQYRDLLQSFSEASIGAGLYEVRKEDGKHRTALNVWFQL